MNRKPALSFWQIWNMCFGFLGIQFGFALRQGFNMSDLANFAHYTGGQGGSEGPLNDARIGALHIAPLSADTPP